MTLPLAGSFASPAPLVPSVHGTLAHTMRPPVLATVMLLASAILHCSGGGESTPAADGVARPMDPPPGPEDGGRDADAAEIPVPSALERCAAIDVSAAPFATLPPSFSSTDAGVPEEIRAKVTGPVVDAVSQFVPRFTGQKWIACGVLDVTLPPYAADSTGAADATDAFQRALDDGRRFMLAVRVPAGDYRIQAPLRCLQRRYQRTEKTITSDRFGGCMLVGAAGPKRPRLFTPNGAPAFADASAPQAVLTIHALGNKGTDAAMPRCAWA